MNSFNDAYAGNTGFFSTEPEPVLVEHLQVLDATRPVLDIGCGQGRHALFLAHRGFSKVHSWEGLGPEHRHGSRAIERHGLARAVLRA